VSQPVVNIAAYKFAPLEALPELRERWRSCAQQQQLKGTILLSNEGVNSFLAGTRSGIDAMLAEIRSIPELADLEVKESFSDEQPFNRLLVKIKEQIIPCPVENVNPAEATSPKIIPQQLKQWLDEGRPITLLDTRNQYEIELGAFESAVDLGIDHFRDFPEAIEKLPAEARKQPVVMYCTGGIRCEKAGPIMQQAGFEEVLQLDGGILKYFEECGGEHYRGDCFVFDKRVALDPQLQETEAEFCFACQTVLSAGELASPHYKESEYCPHCYPEIQRQKEEAFAKRRERIAAAVNPLPGCEPYENQRPMSVPERMEGATLLEFLVSLNPRIEPSTWQEDCAAGRIRYQDEPASESKRVRAGERYIHIQPATVEPAVNGAIELLYEDEAIVVVNKPAPLPMHPCGRFNRNTLIHILGAAYEPTCLRPAHRLDANTSGLVLLSRSRAIAAMIQKQFEAGTVQKRYLARVHGETNFDKHRCEIAISATPTAGSMRLPDPNGQAAITELRTLENLPDDLSFVEAIPVTGRTNQIRIHLWASGHPIEGDPTYLPNGETSIQQTLGPNDPPMCLQAAYLSFQHPLTEELLEFKAAPPAWG